MKTNLVVNKRMRFILSIFSLGAICLTLALVSKNSAANSNAPGADPVWSPATQISQAPFGAYKPVIRYAPTSNAMLIVYDQQMSDVLGNNDPYSAISLNNGTTWAHAPISTTSSKSDQVKGLIDNSDNAFGVWIEHTTSPNEYKLAYGIKPDVVSNTGNLEASWRKGNIMTFPTVDGQLLRDPNIVVDANNTVHVVWIKQDLGQTSILYAYRNQNNDFTGSNYDTWSNPILISTPNPGPPLAEPAIAVDVNGKIHIAWQEEPTPGEIEIRYVRGQLSGGTGFTIDTGRNRIKLSPDTLQEAVLPVLYATATQLHVVFSNQQNGGEYQSAYYANCTLPCNTLASSNFKSVTGSFVSSNDTDPYLLFTDIGYDAENKSTHVYFHGDDGVAASNNELIMGVTSCDNWLVRERATDAASYRAIRPTIAIKNEKIFLAFDKVVGNNHQIFVQSRALDCSGAVYLPIIIKK